MGLPNCPDCSFVTAPANSIPGTGTASTPKSLVVSLNGLLNGGSSGTLENLAESYANSDTEVLTLSSNKKGRLRAEAKIREFRKNNPNGRIAVMGYSKGGGVAVRIINRLGADNISVSPLV